jgi:hypothetical protein
MMMTNPPDTATLRPFLAPLLLKRAATTRTGSLISRLTSEISAIITADTRNGPVEPSSVVSLGGLRLRRLEYVEVRPPAWAPDSDRMDIQHQLVVIATKGDLAAVCASQGGLLGRVAKVGCACLVERAILERAFVGARASVIWMSGIHETTDAKPNAKTLMGSALEYALDPLGDQSFLYSAMRSTVGIQLDGKKDTSIGANPGSSRLWISRPGKWADFASRLEMILDRTATPPPAEKRFDVLARSVDDLTEVNEAYEVGFVPPEMLENVPHGDQIEALEAWAFETDFEIIGTSAADVEVKVAHKGMDLGDVSIVPSIQEGRVEIKAEWTQERNGSAELLEEFIAHLQDGRWTKIRYVSGHTISHAGCYTSAYRDQRFDWNFVDLAGYDVTKEKPDVPPGQTLASQIGINIAGKSDNSLFGYVFSRLSASGWLASDDGSMEIADFIHIADDDLVSLVHVKAAGSDSAARQASASKYEIVVGQAIKNLRHLDRTTLAEALARNQGNLIGAAVWQAGVQQASRAALIARASALPPGYRKRVVILQPQLTKKEHDVCNGGKAPRDRTLRMKQLHTLMLAARLSAGAVGATLEGWAAS